MNINNILCLNRCKKNNNLHIDTKYNIRFPDELWNIIIDYMGIHKAIWKRKINASFYNIHTFLPVKFSKSCFYGEYNLYVEWYRIKLNHLKTTFKYPRTQFKEIRTSCGNETLDNWYYADRIAEQISYRIPYYNYRTHWTWNENDTDSD